MKTILAHGTFDILHVGHIHHLTQARALGDRLVVSITADAFVRKGPQRPIFSADQRKAQLDALRCVDEVIIVEGRNAVPAIERVRPALLVKGLDWQDKLDDPDLKADTAAMLALGGELRFIGPTLASSSALSHHLQPPSDALRQFLATVAETPDQFTQAIASLRRLKVLVIGDPITDIYHTVYPLGLTAKASAVSLRHVVSETYQGGILAIARHVRALTPHVRCLKPQWGGMPGEVTKERWVSAPNGDQPLTKYFAMLRDGAEAPPTVYDTEHALRDSIHWADLVVVGDFGHGALPLDVRKLVQEEAQFLAVMCQTNSANHGFNVLPQRYWRSDMFALDRTELALAAGEQSPEPHATLHALRRQLGADHAFLTRGDVDTIAQREGEESVCPALNITPVDTLGAGDAFFATAALACAAKLPLPLATLVGQLAGSQAAQVVGNREPVNTSKLIEYGRQLLAK